MVSEGQAYDVCTELGDVGSGTVPVPPVWSRWNDAIPDAVQAAAETETDEVEVQQLRSGVEVGAQAIEPLNDGARRATTATHMSIRTSSDRASLPELAARIRAEHEAASKTLKRNVEHAVAAARGRRPPKWQSVQVIGTRCSIGFHLAAGSKDMWPGIYHGWKFDVTGQCIDQPNLPPSKVYAGRVRAPWPEVYHQQLAMVRSETKAME
jgi:hypothetical protein